MIAEHLPLWAVDLDLTLLDTEAVFDETSNLCEDHGIVKKADLYEARLGVEASGGSFDTQGYLLGEGVSEEELQQLSAALVANKARREFLYPDANRFLDALDNRGYPNLIVTWGTMRNQLPKLQASGLDSRPYLITDNRQKGELITSWRTPEGYYQVVAAAGQMLMAETGVLVDDKTKSFTGSPADWAGILVRRGRPKPSQMGDIPKGVLVVPDLDTITDNIE